MIFLRTDPFSFFGFDPLGRCVKRWKGPSGDPNTAAATFFYYDGWNLIQEGPGGTLVDRTYVHGARVDEIVASRVSGTWYNHHYDAQGNCILLSNASGGIQEQYDYDAFGFPYFYTASGGKLGNMKTRFLFTGREWINDLRLYDYRARLYQPELGRFLQPDPKQFEAGDYNLYRYCHNDPVNNSDPTGLREQIAGDIIWDMARYADAANTEQGSFRDFTNGAYMGAGATAGGGDGGGGLSGGGGGRFNMAWTHKGGPKKGDDEFPPVDPQAVLTAAETYQSDIQSAVKASQYTTEGNEYYSQVRETRQGTLQVTKMREGNGVTSVEGENRMAQTSTVNNTNKNFHLVGYIVGYAHYSAKEAPTRCNDGRPFS